LETMRSFVYYGGERIDFDIPRGWNLLYGQEIHPEPGCPDPSGEVEKALGHPIGAPPIEDLASHSSQAVVIFDDITRPTPVHLAFTEVLNRLNQGGIPDSRITGICATGTHQPPDKDGLVRKIGSEGYERLQPRVYCHDATSHENVVIGRTSRGAVVEINPHVADADLVLGIGACIPHGWAGFGGGGKIVMPGVCGLSSIAAHHLTWLRNPHTHSGVTQGNLFYEEANEIARMAGLRFKIDFLLNFKGEVMKLFCGDFLEAHKEAIKACVRSAAVPIVKKADITISAAYPLERGNQSVKSLSNAAAVTKPGGQIIWVAPQPDRAQFIPFIEEVGSGISGNQFHRNLLEGKFPESLKPIGLTFMCTVVNVKNYLDRFSRIIHVTRGLERSQVEFMRMTYAESIEEAIQIAHGQAPDADVVVLPYGGFVLPQMISS
jgi:lactate racemase